MEGPAAVLEKSLDGLFKTGDGLPRCGLRTIFSLVLELLLILKRVDFSCFLFLSALVVTGARASSCGCDHEGQN